MSEQLSEAKTAANAADASDAAADASGAVVEASGAEPVASNTADALAVVVPVSALPGYVDVSEAITFPMYGSPCVLCWLGRGGVYGH